MLRNVMGLNAVWAGLSIANLTGAAAAYIVYRRYFAASQVTYRNFEPDKVTYTAPEK
jgi:Na+-driven multidrug efflux pump